MSWRAPCAARLNASGTRFELAVEIEDLDLEGEEKWVKVDGVVYTARNVILASGSSPRLLNVPGEQEFKGAGISYCATCDGDFYTDKDVVVVGGGNSAMEESLLLLQYVQIPDRHPPVRRASGREDYCG